MDADAVSGASTEPSAAVAPKRGQKCDEVLLIVAGLGSNPRASLGRQALKIFSKNNRKNSNIFWCVFEA